MEGYDGAYEYEKEEQKQDDAEDREDMDAYTGSEPTPLGGLYALFGDLVERKNTIRVGNLHSTELGLPIMTVRDALHIAQLGHTFGHHKFAKFFESHALIVTDSSMSKKGWLSELFVTSKKFASRETSTNFGLPDEEKSKKKLFGKRN